MFLVVGLGNPGSRYAGTRHNIGSQVVAQMARGARVSLDPWPAWQGWRAGIELAGQAVILLQPQTFMNLSGNAVQAACCELQLPPERIIVVHDDLDLSCGRLKLAVNRGSGGHNGIRSIISLLETKAFVRLRIGVGRPAEGEDVSDYVLSPFSEEDLGRMEDIFSLAEQAVAGVVRDGVVLAMNRVNQGK